jgi:phosphoribosyl 1,2-cyclic phosphodiesterase
MKFQRLKVIHIFPISSTIKTGEEIRKEVASAITWLKSLTFMTRKRSCLVRFLHSDGTLKNILVDCGKTFYESALLTFTQHKLRQIDAVILTHSHADAILGLDDLRQWTMNGRVQSSVDIYLNQETYERVEACFPYIVDSSKATGSGEVATVKFHIFDQNGMPDYFMVDELKVVPLPVEHGKYNDGSTFFCMGYRFEDFTYISDTNRVPDSTWEKIKGTKVLAIDALKRNPFYLDIF